MSHFRMCHAETTDSQRIAQEDDGFPIFDVAHLALKQQTTSFYKHLRFFFDLIVLRCTFAFFYWFLIRWQQLDFAQDFLKAVKLQGDNKVLLFNAMWDLLMVNYIVPC